MYLCYIDESGTPEVPGNTSHYVLAALTVPIYKWKVCEDEINRVKIKYDLLDAEIHTGWLIRNYTEQNKITAFEAMPYIQRRSDVEKYRRAELLRLQKSPSTHKQLTQVKKNYEQIVSRVEQYLSLADGGSKSYGLLIHDNNQTVAKRHTALMKQFHQRGTFWTYINNIIETPLFVDSSLTSMIQMADVCSYATRRYLENQESLLFDEVFKRADRRGPTVVGVRHFSDPSCSCKICTAHRYATAVANSGSSQ